MKAKVYIDGKQGTTGLQIYERLGSRNDIELLLIDEDKRKDLSERKKLLNMADLVFLCLPDKAAMEAVALIENDTTRVIDASTAHRTNPDWVYGMSELSGAQKEKIKTAKRLANPGCHASGFIASVYPLVSLGILPKSALLSAFSLTGYSGGGKSMIAEYEDENRGEILNSGKLYGIQQNHKHIPEIKAVCGLDYAPVFSPIIEPFYSGMATTIPLHKAQLKKDLSLNELREALYDYYKDGLFIDVVKEEEMESSIYGSAMAKSNKLKIIVSGNDERMTITSLFDNLGKGASGAAVQNMNLMLGFNENEGL